MAKRVHPRHQADIRAKIQADRLLNWLHAGIFETKFQGKTVVLTNEKVSAAKALLNKTLPDLSSTEIKGDPDKPLVQRIEMVVVDAS